MLFAVYILSIVSALANPAGLNYQNAYLMTQGANVITLLLLAYCRRTVSDAFLASALGVAFTLRATGHWRGGSRWDSLLVTVGMLIILQHAFYAALPRGVAHKTLLYTCFSCIMFPVLSALPHLITAPSIDKAVLLKAVALSGEAYNIRQLSTASPDPSTRPPVWTIRDTETDTSAGVYRDGTDIYVAFAGTESLTNWKTNVNILGDLVPAEWGCSTRSVMRTHKGFTQAFNSVAAKMVEALDSELHTSMQPTRRIVFCGHSLGGALATMAALYASCRIPAIRDYIAVVTFGAPQVGDANFVKFFNEVVPQSVRVANPMDPVPRVLQAQFVHVKGYYPVGAIALDSTFNAHHLNTYTRAVSSSRLQSIVGSVVPAVVVGILLALYIAWQVHH